MIRSIATEPFYARGSDWLPASSGILSRSERSTLINRDMSHCHLVRVGAMGQVGRFAAVDAVRYPRRSRVIVRTRRGLEVGEVLCPPEDSDEGRTEADGDLLRGVTIQDELLQARLEKNRQA